MQGRTVEVMALVPLVFSMGNRFLRKLRRVIVFFLVCCSLSQQELSLTEAAPPARGVTPELLRKGAAIVQDMAVAVAESVAESYLADIGLARAGNTYPQIFFRRKST